MKERLSTELYPTTGTFDDMYQDSENELRQEGFKKGWEAALANLPKNIPDFTPLTEGEIWDGTEMNPCREEDDGKGGKYVEKCEENESPHFWSVYVNLKSGGVRCIADVATKEQSVNLEDLINSLISNYNGSSGS